MEHREIATVYRELPLYMKWLKNFKDLTGRLARWAIKLQQWDFEIVHRKKSQHQLPDALSRIHEEGLVKAFEDFRDPGYLRLVRSGQRNTPNGVQRMDAFTNIRLMRCWIRWIRLQPGGS